MPAMYAPTTPDTPKGRRSRSCHDSGSRCPMRRFAIGGVERVVRADTYRGTNAILMSWSASMPTRMPCVVALAQRRNVLEVGLEHTGDVFAAAAHQADIVAAPRSTDRRQSDHGPRSRAHETADGRHLPPDPGRPRARPFSCRRSWWTMHRPNRPVPPRGAPRREPRCGRRKEPADSRASVRDRGTASQSGCILLPVGPRRVLAGPEPR